MSSEGLLEICLVGFVESYSVFSDTLSGFSGNM